MAIDARPYSRPYSRPYEPQAAHGAIRAEAPAASSDKVLMGCVLAILIGVTFLQRFAVPLGGEEQVHFSMVVALAAIGVLVVTGRAVVDPMRLFLFAIAGAVVALSTILARDPISLPSIALMLVIYVTHILTVSTTVATRRRMFNMFQWIMVITAVAGICQFFLQFAIGPDLLFTFDWLVPEPLLLTGFNTLNELAYQVFIYKANGMVFLEPSTFSQFLALAILIEILFFGITLRIAVYLVAIFVSYSGTGMMLLAIFVPVILIARGQILAIASAIVALMVVVLFGEALNLNFITGRLGEFSSTESSAFARFISPLWMIDDYILTDLYSFLFGKGPGTILSYMRLTPYQSFDPTYGKIAFEYGFLGLISFTLFYLYALYARSRVPILSSALLMFYLLLSGAFLSPYAVFLVYALVMLPSVDRDANRDGGRAA